MAEKSFLKAFRGAQPVTPSEEQTTETRYSAYKQLAERAVEVFGNEAEATRWLSTQSHDFSGKTPLQDFIARGADHALAVLGRIEHGVFF